MIPVMIAAAAASAYMQHQNSEKGRKASEKERRRIQAMIDAIQSPDFDVSMLTPEDYKIIGTYNPEAADYVAEQNPTLIQGQSAEAKVGKDALMNALQKFRGLSESGDDTQSRLLRTQALRDSAIQNQGQQASIQQSMAQRGMGGSGMELVSSLMAQQNAAQNANQSSERAAMDAYNRKLDALRQSSQLGSDIRGQELNMESQNAGIINSYNQRFADARNRYNQGVTNDRNEAQRMNLGAAQQVADKNVGQKNAYAERYQDNLNKYRQQDYNNEMGKMGMQVTQSSNNVNDIQGNVRDQNNTVQGVAQGVTGAAGYYQGRQDREEDRADRAKYGYR